MAASGPFFVPAAPVWAAVRRRQAAWGFSDQEMVEHLGLVGVRVMDCREWMTRPFAEQLLRCLAASARATAGTRAAVSHMRVAEASLHVVAPSMAAQAVAS